MITYNHEKFISQAIEGVLNQECNFEVEFIIADDCSLDNTQNVFQKIKENHPNANRIKYTRHEVNKGMTSNLIWALQQTSGKYIALCDGDDYWTDPYKLQKQVDFLEANPGYSLCVGNYVRYYVNTKKYEDVIRSLRSNETNEKGFSFTLEDTKKGWLTKPLTALFRADSNLIKQFAQYKHGRDINLFYHILKNGKGFYFNEFMGVCHIHEGGIDSMKYGRVNSNASYNVCKELYEINKDEWTRHKSIANTLELFNYNLYNRYQGNTRRKNLKLYLEAIRLARSFRELGSLFINLFPPTFKKKLLSWIYNKK